MSELQEFYAKKSIFITGATGFLGNILLEKLLRSCPEIEIIYLLVRPKNGKSSAERVDALFEGPVFEILRKECPDFRKKIVIVDGNISSQGLGLSTEDRELIVNNVSVIFHVAASIRFNDPLKTTVAHNVESTKSIVDLSRECKHLMAAIYVSTAYSHCPRTVIEEKPYPPPLSYEEVHEILDSLERKNLSAEALDSETKLIIKDWPNTYSFSKAIAEGVVAEYAKGLPFGIVRPSIILGPWKEPVPGWNNSMFNLNGAFIGIGIGVIHALPADPDAVCDLIPADITSNCIIASAWEIATQPMRRGQDVTVYNCISGSENAVTWNEIMGFRDHIYHHISTAPPLIWYGWVILTKSVVLFTVLDFIFHMIPAILVDCVRKLYGKKPIVYNLYRKASDMIQRLGPFAIRQWIFENDNVQNLWNRLGPSDKQIFPFSIRSVVWKEYMVDIFDGNFRYILNTPDDINGQRVRKIRIAFNSREKYAKNFTVQRITRKLQESEGIKTIVPVLFSWEIENCDADDLNINIMRASILTGLFQYLNETFELVSEKTFFFYNHAMVHRWLRAMM